MHKAIVVFEVEGGSDKGADGHRKDTMPIVNAIKEQGWEAEVIYFHPDKSEEIYTQVSENFDAYISRVNPGNIPGGEKGYFELLSKLADAGLVGMSTPADMMAYGAKDALVKLNDTPLVPDDTAAYYEVEELHNIHLFVGAERHDPGFGASVFIATESALVFGVVSHDDCVHTRLRGLHRLDGDFAAFSVVGLKVVRVGYLYRKSEPLASRLLDLNGDLVEA